jgi:ADP-ribosylglycohydrolase
VNDRTKVSGDELRSRIRGCLLAGAVGDALGAPIEFWPLTEIRRTYGESGIDGYLPAYGRDGGAITDDTQMTLFTAEGLIRALVRFNERGICHPPSVIRRAYFRWLHTQGEPWPDPDWPMDEGLGWLVSVPELNHRRAPGGTCLAALHDGGQGEIERPVNDSKGCGAVMRVAPIGLGDVTDPFRTGAEVAALTHGHPSGYLAAGFLAELIARLRNGEELGPSITATRTTAQGYDGHEELIEAVDAAVRLADGGRPTADALESLGAGWVAEEALAIALCAALTAHDLRDGLLVAVNHSGDSDSTGAITGNILGAAMGVEAIPEGLLDGLELREVITEVADDLYEAFWGGGVGDSRDDTDTFDRWWKRYPGF